MKNISKGKNKRGISLVEVILSLALLSVVLVLLASVYGASLHMIRQNAGQKVKSAHASSGVENAMAREVPDPDLSAADRQSGSFTVAFPGVTMESEGEYVVGSDADDERKYRYFLPAEE